jgi:NADH:ubiquinone oxidoreductase subunit C
MIVTQTEENLEEVQTLLAQLAIAYTRPEENRIDVILPPAKLVEAARIMEDTGFWYLSAITGVDHSSSADTTNEEKAWQRVVEGEEQTGFGYSGVLEALYHFCKGSVVATLRVRMGHANPNLPSICGVVPSASLYERELMEMFGISIEDTPVKDHLLLPDDWPVGVYPLRKDFKGFGQPEVEGGANA